MVLNATRVPVVLLANATDDALASLNASDDALASLGSEPERVEGFTIPTMSMAETTAIALLASCAVGALLGLIAVMAVLVAVTRQLTRLGAVLRGEAGVHTGLLASVDAPPPDAFATVTPPPVTTSARVARDGGSGSGSGSGGSGSGSGSGSSGAASRGVLKKPMARYPTAQGSHEKRGRRESAAMAERGTSCAIAEVDEEDDPRL